METVLEHGRLDVLALQATRGRAVSFVLLLGRKALYLLSEQVGLDVLVLEVSPAGLARPRDAPAFPRSLVRDSLDSLKGVARGYFPDGEPVLIMRYQLPAASALHLAGLELHVIVFFGKLAVFWTLVGTVGIQVLYREVGDSLAVLHGILQEVAVGEDRRLDLYGGNDAWLAFCRGENQAD